MTERNRDDVARVAGDSIRSEVNDRYGIAVFADRDADWKQAGVGINGRDQSAQEYNNSDRRQKFAASLGDMGLANEVIAAEFLRTARMLSILARQYVPSQVEPQRSVPNPPVQCWSAPAVGLLAESFSE